VAHLLDPWFEKGFDSRSTAMTDAFQGMAMRPNQGLEGSSQQRVRCWVLSSLRFSAPPQPQR